MPAPRPAQAYLVCATPRSGSTLLCEMIGATGQAGRPLEHFEVLRHSSLPRQPREYFHGLGDPAAIDHLAPLDPGTLSGEAADHWWARILALGSTVNGVWGGKLMWGHVEDLLRRARELDGLAEADLEQVLRALLGDAHMILVSRADKVSQAVSLWRAVQTRSWRADKRANRRRAQYRFAAIDHLVSQLEADEHSWRRWFERSGFDPLHVSYEQLDAAPRETAARVLREIGLETGEVRPPPLPRQRDELSMAWVERYLRERDAAAELRGWAQMAPVP